MSQIKKLFTATARGALVLTLLCALGVAAFGSGTSGASGDKPPVATSVRAITSGTATLITISGTAPMPYTVRRPEDRLLVVELPGVDGSQLSSAYEISSPLVEGVAVKRELREGLLLSSVRVSLRVP